MRGKYDFWRATGGGLAVAVDVRTPTGDEENLLGGGGGPAQFQLGANLLATANVPFPLTDAGIKSDVIPVIGFEYAF